MSDTEGFSLKFDKINANQGTDRGKKLLEHSLKNLGAGRSILTDKEGNVIAGNKTLEIAQQLGLETEIVHTKGDRLVVVVRDDLDINSPEGRELAIADNRVGELDLKWDAKQLNDLKEEFDLNIDDYFEEKELADLLAQQEKDNKELLELSSQSSDSGENEEEDPLDQIEREETRPKNNASTQFIYIIANSKMIGDWQTLKSEIGESDDSEAFSILLEMYFSSIPVEGGEETIPPTEL